MDFKSNAKAQTISAALKIAASVVFTGAFLYGIILTASPEFSGIAEVAFAWGLWGLVIGIGHGVNSYREKIIEEDEVPFFFDSTKTKYIIAIIGVAALIVGAVLA